jgi:hypothetical protein
MAAKPHQVGQVAAGVVPRLVAGPREGRMAPRVAVDRAVAAPNPVGAVEAVPGAIVALDPPGTFPSPRAFLVVAAT